MFRCLWTFWGCRFDPPAFTTMESKKLQQMQQANSHLAPQTKPPTFQQQQQGTDFRSNQSPVFQNQPQYQSFASNFAQINYSHQIRPQQPQQLQSQQQQQHQQHHQQQQQHLSAHSSPKSNSNSLYLSEYSSSSHVGQPQHHHTIGSHYHFDQIYQTSSPSSGSGERDRLYQTAPRPTQHTHASPQPQLSKLELQFQQLQREKIQAQIKTATEALAHQQQTFALRQQLNPPVPNYHLKQNLLQNLSQQHHQQIQHQQQQLQMHQNRNAPPSSLNLTSHFQPAQGPMKMMNQNMHDYGATATNQHPINETLYQAAAQQKQHFHPKTPNNLQSPAPNQIIIQQNIPGHVVNQACQTQISGVKNQSQNQKSPNSDSLSSPSHDGLERRKSGPIHTLKSPVTKRPVNAPISMSGWLYKQGSDGLKVWRRRWFVLSEYILYYYKSQEEEKLLGTVLLPSYKISACFPEDKVYRKFAFKCEHTNMRTFVFAAETAESMTAWVRSLTLATMMQGSSESETSSPSNNARSGDNSDSGIQTYQSQLAGKSGVVQAPVTPVSDNGGGGSQPLYANAPPKPRRANDGGYSSPSPEHIPDARYDQELQPIYGSRDMNQPKPSDAMNNSNLLQTQSPLIKRGFNDQMAYDPNYNDAIYGNAKRIERDMYIQKLIQQQQQQQQQLHQLQQQQQQKQQQQQLAMQQVSPQQQQQQQQQQQLQRQYTNPFMHPNADRRTPDTYGPPRAAMDKHMSDYEDIYNLTVLSKSLPPPNMADETTAASGGYRRPMSPLRYEAQNAAMPQRYTPNYLENSPAQQQHIQMRARPVQSTIPRPHSADFLDYEARNPVKAKLKEEPARAPRPKSSLDINRTPDNYYYSEASYAEKMRMQSVSYLQRTNLTGLSSKLRSDEPHGVNNAGTVPRDGYYAIRSEYGDELQQGSASVPRTQRMTMNNLKKYPSQQEQFLRSASARLPRKEEDPSARDGERKREESMKRLLEWKQRMLQSPLTRKISQQQQHQLSGSPSSTGNPFLTKPVNVTLDAEAYLGQNQSPQQAGLDNKTNLEYNSYSSDDEDGTENTPAGRSSPNVSASASAVLETSEIVPEAEVPVQNPKELLGGDMVDNSQTFSPSLVDDGSNIYENNSIAAASGTTKPSKLVASASFKERLLPLEPESKYVPVYDHSAIIKSPIVQSLKNTDEASTDKTDTTTASDIPAMLDDETDEQSFEYTDQDLEEALQAEIGEDPPNNDDNSDDLHLVDISSENQSFYMPMAPKKTVLNVNTSELKLSAMDILNSIQKCTNDKNIQDENTYIEMTNGMGGKCVFGDDLKSTYEMIVVQNSGSSKADQEPLYMELSQLSSNSLEKRNKAEKLATESASSTLKKKQSDRGTLTRKHSKSKRNDLPDILKSNNSYLKSDDSSDADDESPSKDSSEQSRIKAARSRFSLSDTFRPASYYLGASTSTPLGECVDSSDSEIVSPPPIPTAALPLDEHNSDEIFLSENFDTVKRRDKDSKSNSRSSLLNTSDHRQPSQTSLSGSIDSKSLSGKHPYGSNRSSLQSNLYLGSCYNAERFDNGSNTSSEYDLYRRLKPDPGNDASRRTSTSLSETESVELRRSSSKMDVHTRNKRRPISEDSLNEIQMLGSYGIDETSLSNANFDQYLGNLENVYVNSEESTPHRMVWMDSSLTNLSIGESYKNGHDNSIYYENVEIQPRTTPNTSNRTDDDAKAFYDSLEDVALHEKVTLSPLKEKNLSIHDARCESEDLMAAGRSNLNIEIVDSVTTMSSMDLDQRSSCTVFDLTQTTTPAHSRGNSNLSDSAPYYYSDLQSRDSSVSDITKLSDLSRIKFPPKLNNQRDIGVKKTGISHIQNPINHVKAANILTVAEKDHEIDQRNIYESDRMVDKNVNKVIEVSLSSSSKNYYSNKMMNNKPVQLEDQRLSGEMMPSTSMLASILKSSNSASSSQVLAAISNQNVSSKSSLNISTDMSASGDQLWEEDSLWRDNLRRASHMHAKSMESLDHLGAASAVQSKLSTLNRKHARQAGKAITRDVTYVNDDLLTKTQLLKKQHKSQSSSDDNDVYVQLANNMNRTDSASSDTPSDVYEVLRDESTKYDIDRENIRQWDLMSSGLVNSTNKTLEADDRESHRANKEKSSSRESTLKRQKGSSLGLDGSLQKGAKGTPKTGTGSSLDPAGPAATVDSNDYTPSPGSSHVFATSSDAHVHKKHSNTTTH
ncbi:uncharacterized protein LOC129719072 isoform X3 [Wyeomyia smithii]|uniref:uncharacterized protein LOC129719072 isoform X3 n=1 Tax=Wyeomyia smithii TaxID=174621 RepID=UPI0024680B84|nr:uncharacterized protein LOC129719072 isoform X3 [Wyeomyia smithii]XP_055526418.1 uncharacterized protein LOC129719072 isoform X3 [Wyeomyia smithii]XP_055526419.1 uncharacterized protein LOC129719072 isoform X3 [Wyeomyia smithii]XP_055526420.1 uncharacterized protein LOC129719072 isoform X3 [Wyeomyia smithii]XP_055526421.1 uncharacterized protein LOC129719072 isoform X3 [Wyeomyia smithii]